jgi:hypothetical protein
MLKQSPAREEITNRVEEIAKKKGISMAQVALAWCLSKDGAWLETDSMSLFSYFNSCHCANHWQHEPEEPAGSHR